MSEITEKDVINAVELAIEIHDRCGEKSHDLLTVLQAQAPEGKVLSGAMVAALSAKSNRQRDLRGYPYILHLFRVMDMGKTYLGQIIRVLHDSVEDHGHRGITLEYLGSRGVPEQALKYIEALTHREGESYDDYITRVIEAGPEAISAKMDDLTDNTSMGRLLLKEKDGVPTTSSVDRIVKYRRAYQRLAAAQSS